MTCCLLFQVSGFKKWTHGCALVVSMPVIHDPSLEVYSERVQIKTRPFVVPAYLLSIARRIETGEILSAKCRLLLVVSVCVWNVYCDLVLGIVSQLFFLSLSIYFILLRSMFVATCFPP